MKKKTTYQKPKITAVALDPKQAIVQVCMVATAAWINGLGPNCVSLTTEGGWNAFQLLCASGARQTGGLWTVAASDSSPSPGS